MRKAPVALLVVPALVAVDLGTKYWATQTLAELPDAVPIAPGLSLRLLFNPGVSFGLFAGSPWPVTLVTAAMTAALVIWLIRSRCEGEYLSIAFILAGAASNLVDRLFNGAVTDFLSFGAPERPWFTNNMADMWIGIGVILLFGGTLMNRTKPGTYGAGASETASGKKNDL